MKLVRTRKVGYALAVLVLSIVGARLVAPYYVLKYVNRTLDGLDGYAGHVADVDLHIWRGAYEIEDVRIVKTTGRTPTPLLSVRRIDISVQWNALLDGSIVGEIDLLGPKLNFIADKKKEPPAEARTEKREARRAVEGQSSWQTQAKKLVPLRINRIGIQDGEIHYRDIHTDPEVDIYVQRLRGQLTNLTNSEDLSNSMVARAAFRGLAMGSGKLTLEASVDPYQKTPTFELDVKLEDLEIKQLNDFLKAYANVDAEQGRLSVYTEVAAGNERFKGYVKPLVRDLRLLRWKDEEEGALGKLWEGLVELGSEILENQDQEQIATQIPLAGRLQEPDADVGATILSILRNAFIQALKRGIDQSIGMRDGRTARTGQDD